MDCSCVYVGDDFEPCQISSIRNPVAAKAHKCSECGGNEAIYTHHTYQSITSIIKGNQIIDTKYDDQLEPDLNAEYLTCSSCKTVVIYKDTKCEDIALGYKDAGYKIIENKNYGFGSIKTNISFEEEIEEKFKRALGL